MDGRAPSHFLGGDRKWAAQALGPPHCLPGEPWVSTQHDPLLCPPDPCLLDGAHPACPRAAATGEALG